MATSIVEVLKVSAEQQAYYGFSAVYIPINI